MVYNGVVVGTLTCIPVHPTFPLVYHFNGSGAFPFNLEWNGQWNRDKFYSSESMFIFSVSGSNFNVGDLSAIIPDCFFFVIIQQFEKMLKPMFNVESIKECMSIHLLSYSIFHMWEMVFVEWENYNILDKIKDVSTRLPMSIKKISILVAFPI